MRIRVIRNGEYGMVKRPTCEKGGRAFLGSEGMEAEGGEVGRLSAVVLPCAKSVRISGIVQ
jgi:hypothetical protein